MGTNNLREVIKTEGITPAVLVKESRISSASIARYLNGDRPKDTYISKIIITINKLASLKKYNEKDVFPD